MGRHQLCSMLCQWHSLPWDLLSCLWWGRNPGSTRYHIYQAEQTAVIVAVIFTTFLKRVILSEANGLLKLLSDVFQCWLITPQLISLYVSSVVIHPPLARPLPYLKGQMKNWLWSRSSASPLSCSLSTSKSLHNRHLTDQLITMSCLGHNY